MAIDRWSPFGEMMTLRDAMDRLLQESYVRPGSGMVNSTGRTAMPLDVVENDNDYVVYASMPGVKPQDVQITVQGDTLTVRGETSSSMGEPQRSQQSQAQQTQRPDGQGASRQGASRQGASGQGQQRQSGNYLMRERREATYFRQVTLPTNVNADKAQARFEHGELILTLPKAEEAKPKQIRLQGISPEGQLTSGSQQGQSSGQTSGQTHPTQSATGSQQSHSQQPQSNEKPQHAGAGTHGS